MAFATRAADSSVFDACLRHVDEQRADLIGSAQLAEADPHRRANIDAYPLDVQSVTSNRYAFESPARERKCV